jgi:hypothetical protein
VTRLDEARERCMDALDAWYERGPLVCGDPETEDLIDAYAALKRAQNGEPEDE